MIFHKLDLSSNPPGEEEEEEEGRMGESKDTVVFSNLALLFNDILAQLDDDRFVMVLLFSKTNGDCKSFSAWFNYYN